MDDFNLEDVRIASPCKASWRKMKGDDRVRNCAKCSLNVYNISEMTREEAAELIANTEGRLCIRLWRRRDGTVITKDCPMEFRKLRYGFAVFSSIVIGFILATMQWTRLFSTQELDLIEKKKDLEAGMKACGQIFVADRYLSAGHRIERADLNELEVDSKDTSVIFIGDKLGVDLNLDPQEIKVIDEIAKAKKTSVSKLMRKWISQRIKSYERH